MIPKMRFGRARLPVLAAIGLASMVAAAAQTPLADDDTDEPTPEAVVAELA